MIAGKQPVWIDTDIGSDVDDAIALLYALRHLDVRLVTTVHGCAEKRAQIASRLCEFAGKSPIVCAGADLPSDGTKTYVFWHEGNGLLRKSEPEARSDIETVVQAIPEDCDLICIGPLTNIARYLPIIHQKIRRLYFMGGICIDNGVAMPDPTRHNVKVDLCAAKRVFSSGLPITTLPTSVAKTIFLNPEEIASLPHTPILEYVRQNADDYRKAMNYPVSYMCDPLTAMLIGHPHLFSCEQQGQVHVVTGVDAIKAKRVILETLASYTDSRCT